LKRQDTPNLAKGECLADCESDEAVECTPVPQGPKTPGIWNPLVDFMDVKEDGQMGNVQSLTNFYNAVRNTSECGLPNVSWITPNSKVSEHPPALVPPVSTERATAFASPAWLSVLMRVLGMSTISS